MDEYVAVAMYVSSNRNYVPLRLSTEIRKEKVEILAHPLIKTCRYLLRSFGTSTKNTQVLFLSSLNSVPMLLYGLYML